MIYGHPFTWFYGYFWHENRGVEERADLTPPICAIRIRNSFPTSVVAILASNRIPLSSLASGIGRLNANSILTMRPSIQSIDAIPLPKWISLDNKLILD